MLWIVHNYFNTDDIMNFEGIPGASAKEVFSILINKQFEVYLLFILNDYRFIFELCYVER